MNTNKKIAGISGLLFLAMVLSGMAAEVFFRQRLFSSDDIAANAVMITANTFLYRTGITCDLLMALFYLLTALALYQLLSSVSRNIAAVMVVFAAAGSILLMFNTLNEFAPLLILSGSDWAGAFDAGQKQSLAMLFYDLYIHGYMIGQIFFALWVLPLGMLIMRSGFIPKLLGVLFLIETIFGSSAVLIHFLVPNGMLETMALLPGVLAEFSFMFWLLIRGGKRQESRAELQ